MILFPELVAMIPIPLKINIGMRKNIITENRKAYGLSIFPSSSSERIPFCKI